MTAGLGRDLKITVEFTYWVAKIVRHISAYTLSPKIVLKPSKLFEERELHRSRRAVSLFRDDQLGKALVLFGFLVLILAIYERDNIGVLFDTA